jgi:hypothetical protein
MELKGFAVGVGSTTVGAVAGALKGGKATGERVGVVVVGVLSPSCRESALEERESLLDTATGITMAIIIATSTNSRIGISQRRLREASAAEEGSSSAKGARSIGWEDPPPLGELPTSPFWRADFSRADSSRVAEREPCELPK